MQDNSPSLHGVAGQVDSLLKRFGALDYFRDRVREAGQEQIEAMAEHDRRVKLRRDTVAKEGEWIVLVDEAVAKQKTKEGCFCHSETFHGRINLPSGITKPLMSLTSRAEFPNRPIEPRCLHECIPRGSWNKKDEREVKDFNKKRTEWDKKKSAYVTGPKKSEGGGPSELEKAWRHIFELAKKRSFPDDGDDGLEYVFVVEAWLPADLHPDRDGPTDPLPVPGPEVSLNFKYAGLAAIYDAHWGSSKRIAPWGVVTCGDKVRPASGLPSEWQPPEEPISYRAASWYWRLVRSAKQLDDRNTTIVASWLADVEADLANAGAGSTPAPKGATGSGSDGAGKVSDVPKIYLLNWRDILGALKLANNKEKREQVRALNNSPKHAGPIIFAGQGVPPKAEKSKLIAWWNGLEYRFDESSANQRNRTATVADNYNHGRDAVVAPNISGSIKNRRK